MTLPHTKREPSKYIIYKKCDSEHEPASPIERRREICTACLEFERQPKRCRCGKLYTSVGKKGMTRLCDECREIDRQKRATWGIEDNRERVGTWRRSNYFIMEYLGITNKAKAQRELRSERSRGFRAKNEDGRKGSKDFRARLSKSFIKYGGKHEPENMERDPEVFEMVEVSCAS
jgi:hypothetical protein